MESSCVICEKISTQLTSIFQFKNHHVVVDLIRNVIPLFKFERKDKNVKQICNCCLDIVSNANELRFKSIKTDQKARNAIVFNDGPHCRICLEEPLELHQELHEIFKFRKGKSITNAITALCPISIKSRDKLSHQICSHCLRTIDTASELQTFYERRMCKYQVSFQPHIDEFKIKDEPDDDHMTFVDEFLVEVKDITCETSLTKTYIKQAACQVPRCNQYFPNEETLQAHMIFIHKVSSQLTHSNRKDAQKRSRTPDKIRKVIFKKREKIPRSIDESFLMTELDSDLIRQIILRQPSVVLKRSTTIRETGSRRGRPKKFSIASNRSSKLVESAASDGRNRSLVCRICSDKFNDRYELIDHHIASHPRGQPTTSKPEEKEFLLEEIPLLSQCDFCEEKFSLPLDKRRHMRKQHKSQYKKACDRLFRCKICGEKYRKELDFEAHMTREHQTYFTCSICLKFFNTNNEMNKHILSSHKAIALSLKYCCDHCGKETSKKVELEDHIEAEHFGKSLDVNRFTCKLCTASFKANGNKFFLAQHMMKVHDVILPKYRCCDFCGFIRSNKSHMEEHMKKNHMKEASCGVVCSICGFGCFKEKDLNFHNYIHSEIVEKLDDSEVVVNCSMCHFQATTEKEVFVHMEEHREKLEIGTLKCFRCEVMIENFENLLIHAKKHTIRKNYRCLKCKKIYGYGDALLRHIQNHLNNKCSYCRRAFDTQEAMRKHIEIKHRNLKTVLCPTCGASIKHRVFKNHLKQHMDLPKIKCTFDGCNKEFALRKNLRRHLYSHADANFVCKFCDKSFRRPSVLDVHVKFVHIQPEVRNFSCNICGSKFKRKKDLTKHLKRHSRKMALTDDY